MRTNKLPSVERLHELFYIEDGWLHRRVSVRAPKSHAGARAGNLNSDGYIRVMVDGKRYFVHRLIWVMCRGPIPDGMHIDHIDHDPTNNRIENLRLATTAENQRNRRGAQADSKSGIRGVSPQKGGWQARVRVNGREIGRWFKSKIAAVIFVDLIRTKYFGDFYSSPVTPGLAELLTLPK